MPTPTAPLRPFAGADPTADQPTHRDRGRQHRPDPIPMSDRVTPQTGDPWHGPENALAQPPQPSDGLVEHVVPLAEREPDDVPPPVLVVGEHLHRNRRDPDSLRQLPAQ